MVPAVAERLDRVCPVSRETLEALDHVVAAVEKWSRSINLVADADPAVIWERHVLDSAQLFPLGHSAASTWCDLGTGGGFPGLVVAIIGRERTPQQRFVLVESDRRKAAFLTLMARELGLNAQVAVERAERLEPHAALTVSARALAPLDRLLGWVDRHLAPGGIALLPKGRGFEAEIAAARRHWAFTVDPVPSMVSAQSRILRVTDLRSIDAP
jgi:16S rRNA (guanine527-N7)-methyltransferase